MSDIHQEWRDLRKKNGDFICHLDGEMDKLEKKQVELKRAEQLQNLTDAGAFAMQFVAPPPFNCCQDDRDILKALNKAQADRIEHLEEENANLQKHLDAAQKEDVLFWKNRHIDAMKQLVQVRQENLELRKQLAGAKAQCENTVANRRKISELSREVVNLREQQKVDLAVKKDLDEKLDKAAADYKALWVERDNFMDTISRMEKTIRDLDERNGTLRERLADTNASLKRSIQENSKLRSDAAYIDRMRKAQAKEILRLKKMVDTANGSCSTYAQHGMQSKIAKQAAEIKRLTEENERLSSKNDELSGQNAAQKANVACAMEMWNKYEKEAEDLKKALDIAAKDANANFERGRIKGMTEIWDELRYCYNGRPTAENEKIFGYATVGDIIDNLSPTWFMNKAEECHKQEKKEACNVQIGDEVQCFDLFCPDDDPHSDIGIVVAVDSDGRSFTVIGPNFEGRFDTTDIQFGTVKKTGKHYDSIPLNYLA